MDVMSRLVDALRCLPGIGPKSAQRMAFHLLQHQRQRGLHLASCLEEAMQTLHHCKRCNNYTEFELCKLCQNSARDLQTLCIVETPADVAAVEQSNAFNGSYYVLMGKISPLDGLGPDDIGLPKLRTLVIEESIKEVILALSPTVEGQTTVHFIYDLLSDQPIRISQLAHGIPSGGELEFLDGNTIGNALRNRATVNV
ncbi:Recombination and repair protein recR [Legionella lansingensis]|uniref:Recombination protein RecR n=1 Tax=Legionella lansingensis TaxID=45067 RepID=A0A0W0VPP2_9GAMM|nr:recombination mediator RecR [Legionella lansingensis]KTD22078.1 Recombination and repair protein recR [Legionella lansingensis]SNV45979.1 Recombination and repair protein recR [Legionella lansingensis]